jgi:hypothetical protein
MLDGGRGTQSGEQAQKIPEPMVTIGGKSWYMGCCLPASRILEIALPRLAPRDSIEGHFEDGLCQRSATRQQRCGMQSRSSTTAIWFSSLRRYLR